MKKKDSVNGRRTDNTMSKRKKTNNDLKKYTHKTNDLYCNSLGLTLYVFFMKYVHVFHYLFSLLYPFLFKCLYQARKVSGHACILGVSIVHLSTIFIVDFGIVLVLFRFL